MLLRKEANVQWPDVDFSNPHYNKLYAGHRQWVDQLVCPIELYSKQYKEVLQSKIINRQTSRGNTVLHLVVLHKRKDVIDWLLANGAKPSLSILNVDILTPYTLAA